jgi:hypothetical protein
MPDTPATCTLPPADLRRRIEAIEALAADALLTRERIDGGVRVRFRDAPGVEQRVRDLAVAEAGCCAPLAFAVRRELVLEITGSDDAELFFAPAQ